MRVRGLKLQGLARCIGKAKSHPMRVRGLKLGNGLNWGYVARSHPMRVRGLKHLAYVVGDYLR